MRVPMMTRRIIYRASLSSYLVLGGIFGGTTAFFVRAMFTTDYSFWKVAASFGFATLGFVIWLASFKITITSDQLAFRSLFGGSRSVRIEDIRKVTLGFELRGSSGPLRLTVTSIDANVPKMSINAKVFTSKAVRQVLDLGSAVSHSDSNGMEHGLVAGVATQTRRRHRRKAEQ